MIVSTWIIGTVVEIISQYKYLGTILNNKQARQFYFIFFRKLVLMFINLFKDCVFFNFIESVRTFDIMCWFGNLSMVHKEVNEES